MARHRGRCKLINVYEDRGYESLCIIWQGAINERGYGVFWWRDNGKPRKIKAHRMLYLYDIGEIPEEYDLHHKCEQKDCVNTSHMEPIDKKSHGNIHCGG